MINKIILSLGLLCSPLIAQDCLRVYRFSNVVGSQDINIPGSSAGFDNRTAVCYTWNISVTFTGFSSALMTFQQASDVSGVPGVFSTYAGTITAGSNPINHDGSIVGFGFVPWTRINVTATGTGTAIVVMYGYRASGGTSVSSVLTGCGLSGGPITTAGTIANSISVNLQSGTTYPIVTGDCGSLISQSNGSASAYSIPQAGTTGFTDGWYTQIENRGAGLLTLTPTTSTIDGNANITIATGQGIIFVAKSGNYYTQRGTGTGVVDATLLSKAFYIPIASGSSTVYSGTPVNPPTLYSIGQQFLFKPDITNSTTTPALNVNGLGNKTIVHSNGDAMVISELDITKYCNGFYDNTNIVLMDTNCLTGQTKRFFRCGGTLTTGPATAGDEVLFCKSADGLFYYIDSTNTVYPVSTGSSSSGYDPTDITKVTLWDNWCSPTLNGDLGWTKYAPGGVTTYTFVSNGTRPCAPTFTTDTSNGTEGDLGLLVPIFAGNGIANADFRLTVRLSSVSNVYFGFNFGDSGGSSGFCHVATNFCIGLYLDTSETTTFRANACTGFTCTTTNSTVTPAINTTYTLRIFSTTAGTWNYSVNGETPIIISTNIPANTLRPMLVIKNLTGSTHTVTPMRFTAAITGLTL